MIFIAIGNTRTLLARSDDGHHFEHISIATGTPPASILQGQDPAFLHLDEDETVALGGVVPSALAAWRAALPNHRVYEPDPKTFWNAVPGNYQPPESLGFDRRCCLLGAARNYPQQDSIIIDMGTAITIDLLADGRFQGGRILPGIALTLHSLHLGTALLPDIRLHLPAPLWGNDTDGAIQSGVFHLFADALRNAITAYQEVFPNAQVLITGGDATTWQAHIPDSHHLPDLLLRGFSEWMRDQVASTTKAL